MIIFNTPHNPTGHVATREEARAVAAVCRDYDLLCLSDEAYEDQTFGGAQHTRIALEKGMWERTVTVMTASKMFSVTGWRVGWAIGPEELIGACNLMHSFTTFCAPTPLQEGVAAALEAERAEPTALRESTSRMEENLRELSAAAQAAGLAPIPPGGGYFLLARLPPGAPVDIQFCKKMVIEAGLACMPLSVFYAGADPPTNMVRMAICKRVETIAAAASKLRAWDWRAVP